MLQHNVKQFKFNIMLILTKNVIDIFAEASPFKIRFL